MSAPLSEKTWDLEVIITGGHFGDMLARPDQLAPFVSITIPTNNQQKKKTRPHYFNMIPLKSQDF